MSPRTKGYKLKPHKHWCSDHWHWEQLGGMRLFREEGRQKIYKVRCGVCNRHAEVNSAGKEWIVWDSQRVRV